MTRENLRKNPGQSRYSFHIKIFFFIVNEAKIKDVFTVPHISELLTNNEFNYGLYGKEEAE